MNYRLYIILLPNTELDAGKRLSLPHHKYWILGSSNWNAVCISGVMTVALSILSANSDRLRYVNFALKYGNNYLNGFTKDGFVTEGNIFLETDYENIYNFEYVKLDK